MSSNDPTLAEDPFLSLMHLIADALPPLRIMDGRSISTAVSYDDATMVLQRINVGELVGDDQKFVQLGTVYSVPDVEQPWIAEKPDAEASGYPTLKEALAALVLPGPTKH